MSAMDAWVCVNRSRTSQGRTALMWAAQGGHTVCVQALVAAKASINMTDVSDSRSFACPVTLDLPSTSKSHKRLLRLVSSAAVCVCVYEQ